MPFAYFQDGMCLKKSVYSNAITLAVRVQFEAILADVSTLGRRAGWIRHPHPKYRRLHEATAGHGQLLQM